MKFLILLKSFMAFMNKDYIFNIYSYDGNVLIDIYKDNFNYGYLVAMYKDYIVNNFTIDFVKGCVFVYVA